MSKTHDLKVLTNYFKDICLRKKNFELRLNDRDFQVGDILNLHDFDGKELTGYTVKRTVTYILDNAEKFGLMKGFIIMSIE